MPSSKDPKVAAFIEDVGELEALLVGLSDAWNRLDAKARSMAPKYSPGADGFMALPRLYHEVGELLDDIVMGMNGEDGCEFSLDALRDKLQDLVDVVELATKPRKAVTVDA